MSVSPPSPGRRARRALIAVEISAIATGTAAGLAVAGTHPVAAAIVAVVAAFFALAAIAAALTPGA